MIYRDFKNELTRRAWHQVLRNKTYNIAKNPKYDKIRFDKKSSSSGIKNEIMQDQQLAEQLHKPINVKSKKRKVRSYSIDNVWVSGLADMQLISKFDKVICFLSCFINIYSKYASIVPLKDKRSITITKTFQ